MPNAATYRLDVAAGELDSAVSRAQAFLAAAHYRLGTTLLAHLADNAPANDVIDALGAYQNADGGFGRGLEVDIEAPESNPFATRLAMTVLLTLPDLPPTGLRTALDSWLVSKQHPDGDWHLSPETLAGNLAPWFATWTHPNLNPACCLAGLAARLGLRNPNMFERVEALFDLHASVDDARDADFYGLLPYVEYIGGISFDARDAYLDAIAANITANTETIYADASHFWDHVLAAGPDLIQRLPTPLLDRMGNHLLAEQQADGGWKSPYNAAWRPFVTTWSALTLRHLVDGIG